jgi:hypothetical protein
MLLGVGLLNEVMLGVGMQNVPVGFGPTDLNAYQNNMDNIILYWTMEPYSTDIETQGWVWEVQVSDTSDFANPIEYSSAVIDPEKFISGVIYKGMVVPTPARDQGRSRPMYWRVRVRMGENQLSEWSSATYSIPAAMNGPIRDAEMAFLPDPIYSKGPESNLYKLHNSFATELGLVNDQAYLMSSDAFISHATDAALGPNFGDLIGVPRPEAHGAVPALTNVDYRSILRAYMTNIRHAPAVDAVSKMVYAIYRGWPTYYSVSNEQDDFIVTAANVGQTAYFVYSASTPPGGDLEAYILNKQNIDFGVIIEIANKMTPENKLILTEAWAQAVIKRMIQAHVPVYFRYV